MLVYAPFEFFYPNGLTVMFVLVMTKKHLIGMVPADAQTIRGTSARGCETHSMFRV